MNKINQRRFRFLLFPMLLLVFSTVLAQTTTFTYQGRLTDGGTAANGSYDLQFSLFDTNTVGTGTQQGLTVGVSNVTVNGGVFIVQLDFGASVFPGASSLGGASPDRFLEIAVKQSGAPNITTLSPRQQLTSTPYSIRSLNATSADGLSPSCDGCIISSQIRSLSGSAISGTIPVDSVPAGSANYIQNTLNRQLPASFNISGNGTLGGTLAANLVNATTQYNINGARVLSTAGVRNTLVGVGAGIGAFNTGGDNAFFGFNAGSSNTLGRGNAFFGSGAGLFNTSGTSNSFFGNTAGESNSTGVANSFFGGSAGVNNTTGGFNSFFGGNAGLANSTAAQNSFFGFNSGFTNSSGSGNSFFGFEAGKFNTTASGNSFFGDAAGLFNTTGSANTFFGSDAGSSNTTAGGNSFFGSQAGVGNVGSGNSFFGFQSGELNGAGNGNSFFGRAAGGRSSSGSNNAFFGSAAGLLNKTDGNSFFGAQAGQGNTSGSGNSFFGFNSGAANSTGGSNAFFGSGAGQANTSGAANTFVGNNAGAGNTTGINNTYIGASAGGSAGIQNATAIGAGAFVTNSFTMVLGTQSIAVQVPGTLAVSTLGASGSTQLCRNASNQISTCSSSLRYKTAVRRFIGGLDVVNRLHPISFTWKQDGTRDLGLGAEDVARVEPLLVIRNEKGEVEGVKYDHLNVVLINAIQQQQAQIKQQQTQIDSLKKLVCQDHPQGETCN